MAELKATFEILADHVLATYEGKLDATELEGSCQEALNLAAANELRAVLLDVRNVDGSLSDLQRYELGLKAVGLQANYLPRIAIAVLGHEPLIDPRRFGETVAQNRGGLVRVFTDQAAIREWIQGFAANSPRQAS